MKENKKSQGRNLSAFFAIAYGFSWLFWLPQVLFANNLVALPDLPVYLAGFIAPFGPLVSAFLMTYLTKGAEALKEFSKRGAQLGFKKKWLIIAFLFFPIWAGVSFLLGVITENALVSLPWFNNPLSIIFNLGVGNFVYMFIFVGIAEEFGWRGYALDLLQKRLNAANSSIILGLFWGFWHLPLFFIAGSPQQTAGIPLYLLQIVVFSIWHTWLYNNSGKSLFPVIIFHTMMDLVLLVIFPISGLFAPSSLPSIFLYTSGLFILIFIIAYWGPKTLKRK